jgi:hypothetical protein
VSPTTENHSSPSVFLAVDHSNHNVRYDDNQPRRRRLSSSSSSIIQGKFAGVLSSSTSSLVGDLVLKIEDVIKLKENLRKTGLVKNNETLRRKLPTESIQVDFRSILRPSKNNQNTTKQ